MKIWINGRAGTVLNAGDRGLHYGDGVFETLWVEEGRIRLLTYHLDRLFDGCKRLHIAPPGRREIRGELERVAHHNRFATLKLIITRGAGARGYAARELTGTTRALFCYPRSSGAQLSEAAGRLRLCRTRCSTNPSLAGIKSLNRLDSVLARSEWNGTEFNDGLMQDADGHIVCGTMSNVFMRKGRALLTPRLDRCGVHGVMRRWVMRTAPSLGLSVRQSRISVEQLRGADEIFITNALIGVQSIASIARLAWRPGEARAARLLRTRLERI